MRNRCHIGPIYYVTTVVHQRLKLFTQPAYIVPLYDSLHYYCSRYRCGLVGYVVMPDHIHLMLWPHNTPDISAILRDFKTFTAKRIVRQAMVDQNDVLLAHFCAAGEEVGRSEHKVWQDSFWESDVFSERFVRQKLNYMHRNPLRAGLVQQPEQYPYSSYRNYQFDEEWLIKVDRSWL